MPTRRTHAFTTALVAFSTGRADRGVATTFAVALLESGRLAPASISAGVVILGATFGSFVAGCFASLEFGITFGTVGAASFAVGCLRTVVAANMDIVFEAMRLAFPFGSTFFALLFALFHAVLVTVGTVLLVAACVASRT
jgi:hypothetical protein